MALPAREGFFAYAAHGQAVLRTTSQALRASSPSRGASGETVHFAGTAKASPTRSNGDDRRQWRKQGGAVGAAASRMRAAAKQTLGAATRLSEAASFFPFRQLLWGLKGASSPFLVDPARRNRWWFSGSLLTSKENISLNANALCPAHRRENHFWFSFGAQKRT